MRSIGLSFAAATFAATIFAGPAANGASTGNPNGIWLIGLPIFIEMRAAGPNKWSGRIYNSNDGKTYASTVTLQEDDKLEVQGCLGSLCGSDIWSRSSLR